MDIVLQYTVFLPRSAHCALDVAVRCVPNHPRQVVSVCLYSLVRHELKHTLLPLGKPNMSFLLSGMSRGAQDLVLLNAGQYGSYRNARIVEGELAY